MKIVVRAKPSSKIEKLEKVDETHFRVCVKEQTEGGKANKAIIRVLANHLGVAPSNITLASGASSRQKVFKIANRA